MHQVLGAILAPAPKIVVDDLPGREIMGQQAPGTPATHNIQNALEDFALWVLLRSAPALGRGHIGLDEFLLGVT
jgi:hypothetical protein